MIAGVRRWWSHVGIRGRRELLLVALLLFCYGFFQQVPAWNEYSRYDLVRALVDQGTTRIDSYQDNTGDKAFFQGHWYSDKAPGSALLGGPVYSLARLTGSLAGQTAPSDVTAVQVLRVNQPSDWQKRFQSFDQQQQDLLRAAEPASR